jgi:hypothetical protein
MRLRAHPTDWLEVCLGHWVRQPGPGHMGGRPEFPLTNYLESKTSNIPTIYILTERKNAEEENNTEIMPNLLQI